MGTIKKPPSALRMLKAAQRKMMLPDYIRLEDKFQMTNEELIIYQAKKIAELQTNVDFWMQRFLELQGKNRPEVLLDAK